LPDSRERYGKHGDHHAKLLKCAAFLQCIFIFHLRIPGGWIKTEEYLNATSL